MTLASSGLAAPGRNSSREAAGMPRASSARHISGSQATVAVRLTWPATQAAACARIAVSSALARLPLPAAAGACRLSISAMSPASATTTITALVTARRLRVRRCSRCGDETCRGGACRGGACPGAVAAGSGGACSGGVCSGAACCVTCCSGAAGGVAASRDQK